VAAVLKIILGIMEDQPKEIRRVAAGDKAIEEQVELAILVSSILD
jgi:hypothetical protein